MDAEARAQGDVLIGRYVLQRRLGAGGAGVVWRAQDRVLERAVAVKLLHPELAHEAASSARFRAEATSAAKLTHPNAVIVYDIGRDGDRDFLVMELVDGPSLAELFASGPMSSGRVAHIGAAVASALGMAHSRGMLHRDVKPANVLLTADGVPKVADFGIARALGAASTRLTDPGSVIGTARYLAPEQLLDERLDGRVDVYALGLVLYEALTGRPPWGEGTAVEVASRRLAGDLQAPSRVRPDIAPDLDAVVRRATRLNADERYPEGTAMAAALAPLVGDHADRGRRTERSAHPSRTVSRVPDARPTLRPATLVGSPSPPSTYSTRRPDVAPPGRTRGAAQPPPSSRGSRDRNPRERSTTQSSRERRPKARHRGRRMLAWLVLLVSGGVGLLGVTDTPIPSFDEVTEVIRTSPAGDAIREVRDLFVG